MVVVCKADDLAPGQMTSAEVDGEPVTIANVGGSFYAFNETCTHRGCSLTEGELAGNVVTCDCHGGQFDVVSGEVVDGPPDEALQTYQVSVNGGDLTIG